MAFGIDNIIDATETTTGEAGLDMLAEAVANSGVGKKDKLEGKDQFNAVVIFSVLPDGRTFSTTSLSAMLGTDITFGTDSNPSDSGFAGYRVRITDEDNPHAFYPMPCPIDTTAPGAPSIANKIIGGMHTMALVSSDIKLTPGDKIIIKLRKLNGNYDLKYAHFISRTGKDQDYFTKQQNRNSQESCQKLGDVFTLDATKYLDGSPNKVIQSTYTGLGGTGLQLINGELPPNLLVEPDPRYTNFPTGFKILVDCKTDWDNLAKKYTEVFGRKIQPSGPASGFRSLSSQVSTYARAPLTVNSAGRPVRAAATPGSGRPPTHGFATAVDINRKTQPGDTAVAAKIPALKKKQDELKAAGITRSISYIWLFLNAPAFNWGNPSWAQKPEASTVLGRPCVPPPGKKCGSKIEPWHWEWGGYSTVFSNTIKVDKPPPGASDPLGSDPLDPELDDLGQPERVT
tara:strand:- start:8226 stop:9596 length:1371 start_codon:yes stop_codon:yes gene_type:complete